MRKLTALPSSVGAQSPSRLWPGPVQGTPCSRQVKLYFRAARDLGVTCASQQILLTCGQSAISPGTVGCAIVHESSVTLRSDRRPLRPEFVLYPRHVSSVAPTRFRRGLAAGLVAIALISVATPALACALFVKSGPHAHSCCEPATKLQGNAPAQSENACCVTVTHESPSAPVAVFKCAPQVAMAVAHNDLSVVPDAQLSVSDPFEVASSPPCNTSSVLRV